MTKDYQHVSITTKRVISYFHTAFLADFFGKHQQDGTQHTGEIDRRTAGSVPEADRRREEISGMVESIRQGLQDADFEEGKLVKAVVHDVSPPDVKAVHGHDAGGICRLPSASALELERSAPGACAAEYRCAGAKGQIKNGSALEVFSE